MNITLSITFDKKDRKNIKDLSLKLIEMNLPFSYEKNNLKIHLSSFKQLSYLSYQLNKDKEKDIKEIKKENKEEKINETNETNEINEINEENEEVDYKIDDKIEF